MAATSKASSAVLLQSMVGAAFGPTEYLATTTSTPTPTRSSGTADLVLGGERGVTLTVEKGDVLVLPAGTGHRRLRHSPNFLVVGGYPRGQQRPDEYLSSEMCANCRNRLRAVALPKTDPLYGDDGVLLKAWQTAGHSSS